MLFARGPIVGLRLIILIFFSIVLILGDSRGSFITKKWHESVSYIILPITHLANFPFTLFDNVAKNMQAQKDLLDENATLRATVMILQGKLQKLQALQLENKELRGLLQSSKAFHQTNMLLAQVMAVQVSPYLQEIVLNKGSKAGVFIGQAVLDASGIMGQVIEVSPYNSRALLITDPKSGIPVQNSRTGMHGILTGHQKPGLLRWNNVPEASDVKVGDLLYSSGLGGHYPVGYPVGVVIHINSHTTDQFLEIDVAPSAKLNSSEQVLLVWNTKSDD